MEPVRIKYYGVMWMTKRGYLLATLAAVLIIAAILLIAYPAGYLPRFRWPWEPVPNPKAVGRFDWLYNHFYDICLFCFLAEAIDIVVTMRTFARKEADRRASPPAPESISPH